MMHDVFQTPIRPRTWGGRTVEACIPGGNGRAAPWNRLHDLVLATIRGLDTGKENVSTIDIQLLGSPAKNGTAGLTSSIP